MYPSDLADNGYVGWKTIETNTDQVGPINYNDIRWEFNMQQLGWTTLQHATYLRGSFEAPESGTYLISFKGLVSYKIDQHVYPGNVYGFDHGADSAIYLSKGVHKIYACLVLDVRIHGGSIPPQNSFTGSIKLTDSNDNGIKVYPDDTILPEIMNDRLITSYGSVTIKNTFTSNLGAGTQRVKDGPGWKQIKRILVTGPDNEQIPTSISTMFTIMVSPGQTIGIPFKLETPKKITKIKIEILFLDLDSEDLITASVGNFELKERKWGEAYKLTFIGYDSAIQEGTFD